MPNLDASQRQTGAEETSLELQDCQFLQCSLFVGLTVALTLAGAGAMAGNVP